MIDQSFLDLFANIDSKEGFYLWLFMLISFLFGFLIALLLRWSRIRKLKKELKAVSAKEQAFNDQIAQVEATLQERNVELQEASREKVDLMDRLAETNEAQQLHMEEVFQLNQEIETLKATNKTYAGSIDDLNDQVIGLQTQNEQLGVATLEGDKTASGNAISKEAYASMQERLNDFEKSLKKLSDENGQLRSDLQVIKKKGSSTSVSVEETEQEPHLQVSSDKTVLNDKIVVDDRHKDDLTKIEGIGAFVAKKLNSIGVFTYEDIASWDTVRIDAVTEAIEYLPGRIQKDDWVGQAAMLLVGHKEDSKPLVVKKAVSSAKDDLKVIEGIGPKIEGLINDAGIFTWESLAGTDPGQLKEILEAAGGSFRMHTPYTWPLQARLAAAERWDELKQYQEELKGGK